MGDNINLTLNEILAALLEGTCNVEVSADIDPPQLGVGDVPIGTAPTDRYETIPEYSDAKCNAANYIADGIEADITWLKVNNADMFLGAFGGLTGALIFAHLSVGPPGWIALTVEAVIIAVITLLSTTVVNFSDLEQAWQTERSNLVQAMASASSVPGARTEMLTILEDGAISLTAVELQLLSLMLSNKKLNVLFDPTPDAEDYQSPQHYTCTTDAFTWSFNYGKDGFKFRQESTHSSNYATGQWSETELSLQTDIHLGGGTTVNRATGIWTLPLALPVVSGMSVEADFYRPPGESNYRKYLYLRDDEGNSIGTDYDDTDPGETVTLTANITGEATLAEIEVRTEIENIGAGVFDRETHITEVRLKEA